MGRKREDGSFATRVITDRAAYNQYMRDYRARKKAEARVAHAEAALTAARAREGGDER